MLRVYSGLTLLLVTSLSALWPSGFAAAQDGLKVGDKAPDFEVATFGDKTVKLSDRFGDNGKTTVLLFSRANW